VLDDSSNQKTQAAPDAGGEHLGLLAQLSYDSDEGPPTDCHIATDNFKLSKIVNENYINQSLPACMNC
jgi:hypothetical protein